MRHWGDGWVRSRNAALDFGKRVILIEKINWAALHHNGAIVFQDAWELSRDVRRLRVTERGYTVFRITNWTFRPL